MAWHQAIIFLIGFWQPLCTWCQSVSSCGAAGDHFKSVKVAVSPDPIAGGKPFSFTLSGTLDEAIIAGSIDVELNIKALDVVSKDVHFQAPFTAGPGIVAGPQALTIGPLSLPELPGSITVSGTVRLTNEKNEPISCFKINLHAPALSSDAMVSTKLEEVPKRGLFMLMPMPKPVTSPAAVSMCSQPSDHLKSLAVSKAAGVTSITGTFDELVAKMMVNYDLKLKVSFFTHTIKLAIPVSYTPGIVKGPFKLTIGPTKELETSKLESSAVSLTGTVKIDDGASQEITCLSIGANDVDAGLITV